MGSDSPGETLGMREFKFSANEISYKNKYVIARVKRLVILMRLNPGRIPNYPLTHAVFDTMRPKQEDRGDLKLWLPGPHPKPVKSDSKFHIG